MCGSIFPEGGEDRRRKEPSDEGPTDLNEDGDRVYVHVESELSVNVEDRKSED